MQKDFPEHGRRDSGRVPELGLCRANQRDPHGYSPVVLGSGLELSGADISERLPKKKKNSAWPFGDRICEGSRILFYKYERMTSTSERDQGMGKEIFPRYISFL